MRKYIILLILVISSMLTAQNRFQDIQHSGVISDAYMTYTEIIEFIEDLQNEHPEIVNIIDIGVSQESLRSIKAVIIGNNPALDNLLLLSGIRANDISNVYMNIKLMESLVGIYAQGLNQELISNANFYFIPVLNPDGYSAVLENSLLNFQNNTRDINQNNILDPLLDGVDLYYNYDNNWIHGNKYNANNNGSLNFRGFEAYSESETLALKIFLDEYNISSALVLNNVSQGKKVIYPYNWLGLRQSTDYDNFHIVSQGLINGQTENSWATEAQNERNGNILDWLFVHKSINAFMLSNEEFQNIPNPDLIDPIFEEYFSILMNFSELMLEETFDLDISRLDIITVNGFTQEKISAYYKIEEFWSESYLNHKTKSNGKIKRFLIPGLYNLQIKQKGYKTVNITDLDLSTSSSMLLEVPMFPLETAVFQGSVSFEGMTTSGKIIIRDVIPDTVYFDPGFSVEYYQGVYQIDIISDDHTLMPYSQEIVLTDFGLNLHFELTQNMTLLEEMFQGACCNWIFDGPWLVVSDPSQNGAYLANSWDWETFYSSGADISISTIYPISLFSFYNREAYLEFDSYSHTEWDNDFISVELIRPDNEPETIWSRSGKYDYWEKIIIPISDYIGEEFFVKFRLKDGIPGNVNHPAFTDPGWKIDNIRLKVGAYSTNISETTLPKPVKKFDIYPNPFNPVTNFRFYLPGIENEDTRIKIFNVKGQMIEQKIVPPTKDDYINIQWNAEKFSSGIYFINIKNSKENIVKKAVLLK